MNRRRLSMNIRSIMLVYYNGKCIHIDMFPLKTMFSFSFLIEIPAHAYIYILVCIYTRTHVREQRRIAYYYNAVIIIIIRLVSNEMSSAE